MPRHAKSRRLNVWMNGEMVGQWLIRAQGQHSFHYEEEWLASPAVRPISLSMPLRPPDAPYVGPRVEAFFDNLLPDSIDIRRRVQSRFETPSSSPFDLLAAIGRDCAGAIQLLPAEQRPEGFNQIRGEALTADGVAAALRAVVSATPFGQQSDEPFRISIAGAQEKTALLWHKGSWHRPADATPSTHIFKLPLGSVGISQLDLSTSVENEWLCAQILGAFGLDVAHCEIADFDDQHTLIVQRFDRRLARNGNWWMRLPQEDMCQATGTPPAQKYESQGGPGILEINSLLLGSRRSDTDRRDFFRTQVVFWMLCAIDGHAKNFSVSIEPQGRFALTPLYDILSAYPVLGVGKRQLAPKKATMAMAVTGKNRHYRWAEIQPRHWLSTAEDCGLAENARQEIVALAERAKIVTEVVSGALPRGFPDHVAQPIFDGLLSAAKRLKALA